MNGLGTWRSLRASFLLKHALPLVSAHCSEAEEKPKGKMRRKRMDSMLALERK